MTEYFFMLNDGFWPGTASCDRHTVIELRKAAIGSTRP
jgi:hypothetical protein